MLILACVLLAVGLVPLTGGRLSRLAELRWRRRWLLVLALAVQVVVMQVPGVPTSLAAAAHLVTYAMAGTFVVLNRRVRGLLLLALGAACNGVTIALNGGTLPSTAAARALAGLADDPGFANSGVVAHPVLAFLGDNFAVPAPLPLANVFSIGDVLILAGACWVLFAATRPCDRGAPSPPDAGSAAVPDSGVRGAVRG